MWLWCVAVGLANPYAPSSGAITAPAGSPFQWKVPSISGPLLELQLVIPEGHAVYRDGLGIAATRGSVGAVDWPVQGLEPDPANDGAFRAIYRKSFAVKVPVTPDEHGLVEFSLDVQGCMAGLCWPVSTTHHTVRVSK